MRVSRQMAGRMPTRAIGRSGRIVPRHRHAFRLVRLVLALLATELEEARLTGRWSFGVEAVPSSDGFVPYLRVMST